MAPSSPPSQTPELEPLGIKHPLCAHQPLGQTVPGLQFRVPLGTRPLTVLNPSIFNVDVPVQRQLQQPFQESPFFERTDFLSAEVQTAQPLSTGSVQLGDSPIVPPTVQRAVDRLSPGAEESGEAVRSHAPALQPPVASRPNSVQPFSEPRIIQPSAAPPANTIPDVQTSLVEIFSLSGLQATTDSTVVPSDEAVSDVAAPNTAANDIDVAKVSSVTAPSVQRQPNPQGTVSASQPFSLDNSAGPLEATDTTSIEPSAQIPQTTSEPPNQIPQITRGLPERVQQAASGPSAVTPRPASTTAPEIVSQSPPTEPVDQVQANTISSTEEPDSLQLQPSQDSPSLPTPNTAIAHPTAEPTETAQADAGRPEEIASALAVQTDPTPAPAVQTDVVQAQPQDQIPFSSVAVDSDDTSAPSLSPATAAPTAETTSAISDALTPIRQELPSVQPPPQATSNTEDAGSPTVTEASTSSRPTADATALDTTSAQDAAISIQRSFDLNSSAVLNQSDASPPAPTQQTADSSPHISLPPAVQTDLQTEPNTAQLSASQERAEANLFDVTSTEKQSSPTVPTVPGESPASVQRTAHPSQTVPAATPTAESYRVSPVAPVGNSAPPSDAFTVPPTDELATSPDQQTLSASESTLQRQLAEETSTPSSIPDATAKPVDSRHLSALQQHPQISEGFSVNADTTPESPPDLQRLPLNSTATPAVKEATEIPISSPVAPPLSEPQTERSEPLPDNTELAIQSKVQAEALAPGFISASPAAGNILQRYSVDTLTTAELSPQADADKTVLPQPQASTANVPEVSPTADNWQDDVPPQIQNATEPQIARRVSAPDADIANIVDVSSQQVPAQHSPDSTSAATLRPPASASTEVPDASLPFDAVGTATNTELSAADLAAPSSLSSPSPSPVESSPAELPTSQIQRLPSETPPDSKLAPPEVQTAPQQSLPVPTELNTHQPQSSNPAAPLLDLAPADLAVEDLPTSEVISTTTFPPKVSNTELSADTAPGQTASSPSPIPGQAAPPLSSIQQKTAAPSAKPQTDSVTVQAPSQWSSIADLLTQTSTPTAAPEPYQPSTESSAYPDLFSDSPVLQPKRQDGLIAQPELPPDLQPFAEEPNPSGTTENAEEILDSEDNSNPPKGEASPEQLEQLAQAVYQSVRQRLMIERERAGRFSGRLF
mgnify:CR=1 FL=1